MNISPYRRQAALYEEEDAGQETQPWWIYGLAAVGLVLLCGWLLAGVYLYFRFAGPVAPGVRVGDTEVGGLSLEQAAAVIDNAWNRERTLVVSDGKNYWQAQPLEFGLWVNPQASAERAYAYGRGERRFSQLLGMLTGAEPDEVQPAVVFSPKIAAAQLANWGPLVDRPPEPASLQFIDGHWTAVPGAPGARFDAEATLKSIAENAELIARSGYLPLVTQPVPSPVEDLSAQIAALEEQLNRPLRIHGYDPIGDETLEWIVPRETLGSWMQAELVGGEPKVRIDENSLLAYLNQLESQLGGGRSFDLADPPYAVTERWQNGQPFRAVIHHPATTYTVQEGDTLLKISYRMGIPLWMIYEANPGMDVENILVGQTLNIPSKSDLLPLPVVWGKRIVLSISRQRMWIYENGEQIREFVISTGVDRSPTQPGVFQVQTHELSAYASVWELTMPHFLGIYEAWPGFMNGIHGLPTLKSGVRLWESILGRPASYGCIILKLDEAEWLYNWAEDGVVVEIQA